LVAVKEWQRADRFPAGRTKKVGRRRSEFYQLDPVRRGKKRDGKRDIARGSENHKRCNFMPGGHYRTRPKQDPIRVEYNDVPSRGKPCSEKKQSASSYGKVKGGNSEPRWRRERKKSIRIKKPTPVDYP